MASRRRAHLSRRALEELKSAKLPSLLAPSWIGSFLTACTISVHHTSIAQIISNHIRFKLSSCHRGEISLLSKKSQLSGSTLHSSRAETTFGGTVGFGKAYEYGLGEQFSADAQKENYRYNDAPVDELVPDAVKSKKLDVISSKAAKKGRLAYSGISA